MFPLNVSVQYLGTLLLSELMQCVTEETYGHVFLAVYSSIRAQKLHW